MSTSLEILKTEKSSSTSSLAKPKPWTPEAHHKLGVKFLLAHSAGGLLLDPGLGKTSITLKVIQLLKASKVLRRALVIAPLRPCYMVWPAEWRKWTDFKDLKMEILHGNTKAQNKDDAIERAADIYVINPDGLPWLFSEKRFEKLGIDTLIIDESSKFKHTKTQRFKQLKPYLNSFKRRWILTGSPNPNGYEDLFGQIYILDLGYSLGQYITQYRFTYFFPTGYGGYTWKLKKGADKAIQQKIKPLALRLEAADYIKMPQVIPSNIYVDLPPKAREKYDELEEEMFTTLDGGQEVSAVSSAAVSVKCRQVANGGLYFTEEDATKRQSEVIHDAKTDALVELINELNGNPLIVAYDFQHDLERILAAIGKNTPYIGGGTSMKDSMAIERKWNAGEIAVLPAQPQAMGHGLNLQEGSAHHICWYSLIWDFELYDQFIRRLWRSGNNSARVFVYHIVARDTTDEPIMRALKYKDKTQRNFMNALKEYRGSRRKT